MKNLEVLNCQDVGRFDNNDLAVIADSFPNLETLNFGHLDAPQVHVTDEGIEFLASKLGLLKWITIYGQHSISDQSLVALSLNHASLKSAIILCPGATVTEIGLLLRKLPNLEALSIDFIKIIDSSSAPITIENSISFAKALTFLKFSVMNISDNLLKEIAKGKLRLKDLWPWNCNKFTATGLLMVLSNYRLDSLCIENASIVDADMELLLNGDVRNLTCIEAGQCQVTNSTLFRLSTKRPSPVDIMLNNTAIGEQVLNNIPLSTNYSVQNLYLANYFQINVVYLIYSALMFPNLRFIDLSFAIGIPSISIEVILMHCKISRTLLLRGYRKAKIFEAVHLEFPDQLKLEELTLSYS